MAKKLTTENAIITTAQVEVKTLTINGKQVTLAVFRQLRRSGIFAPDGTLRGVPWGFVNYHPDNCAGTGRNWRPPHRHLVWQRGHELLRDEVKDASWGQNGPDTRVNPGGLYVWDGPPGLDSSDEAIARFSHNYVALGDLPQLFIAV